MKKLFAYLILLLLIFPASIYSQIIDSLNNLLKNSDGKQRIELLLKIGEEYLLVDPNQSLDISEEAISLSNNSGDRKLSALSIQLKAKSLFRKNEFLDSKKYLFIALNLFGNLKDTANIALVYDTLGDVYDRLGNRDSSLVSFNIVQQIAVKIGDKKLESLAYSSMGLIYWRQGKNKNSLENHFKALEIRKEINFLRGIAMTTNNIGVVYWRMGNFLKALNYYTESLTIREQSNDRKGIITTKNNIGLIYLKLNNYEKARKLFEKCLTEAEQIDYTFGVAYSNHCLSIIHLELKDFYKSISHSQKAMENYSKIGEMNSVTLSMNYLGKVYSGLKQYDKALEFFNTALATAERINDKFSAAHILQSKAQLFLEQNDLPKAKKYLKRSLKIAEEENFFDLLIENNLLYSKIMKKSKNNAEALKYFENYVSLKESLRLEQLSTDISEWQLREKEYENELLRRDNKLKAAQVEKEIVYRNWLIGFSIIFMILLIGLFRHFYYKRKTSKKILEQNEELERLNKMLSEKNTGLEENNRAKDRLFSVIAHDLKTPFQALLGYSEMMSHDIDELSREDTIEYSKSINKSAKNLLTLTQSLLNWSRLQFHKFSIIEEDILLDELIEKIVCFQKDIAEGKKIDFVTDIENQLTIKSDEEMLQTILRNLTSNAVKFSQPGGKIKISASRNHKNIVITVKDYGVGISNERMANIFSLGKFESTSGTQNEKGTGLGLIIAKEFVVCLGGDIIVESELNKGTIFKITLPPEISN